MELSTPVERNDSVKVPTIMERYGEVSMYQTDQHMQIEEASSIIGPIYYDLYLYWSVGQN